MCIYSIYIAPMEICTLVWNASRIARMYIYDSYERYVDIFFQAKRLSRSKRAEAQPCKCN